MNKTPDSDVTRNVLIVDKDAEVARVLLKQLARRGIRGTIASDEKSAIRFLENTEWQLVFLSCRAEAGFPCRSGFELLRRIRKALPELPVIMLGPRMQEDEAGSTAAVRMAVKAIHSGCMDFVLRPIDERAIENVLDTFVPNHSVSQLASAQENMNCLYEIVGSSGPLAETVSLARKVAPTSAAVLITGESGTGKELLAYLIHNESRRRTGPYVRVNCAALSDSLLESELFGHEKGAFTGAYTQRKGRFEMAHGGTLLLDEISETGVRFQAGLLRALEQQDFERVGGNENIRVNIRVISTTNKNILQEVQNGRFRADLYYRLTGIRLILPPLRVRTDDLPVLIWHFVNQFAGEAERRITKLDPVMLEIFKRYGWPGNVRQLRNVVRTSLILGAGETLSLADVSWLLDELQPRRQENCPGETDAKDRIWTALAGVKLEEVEQYAILATLRESAGNRAKAAKRLGISDRTLREKIRRYREQGCLQLTG